MQCILRVVFGCAAVNRTCFSGCTNYMYVVISKGWLGGAMVLDKLPVPGRPTIWVTVGQVPTALAVGAEGVVWTFLLSSILSFLFLPLLRRRPI